ncbi:MAG: Fe2+/Zn2+ uptake regulation protein [Candidatus Parcubacteria bacterium]
MKTIQIETILRDNKLKVTPKRTLILGTLVSSKLPLSVADILVRLPQNADIDTVTVYRNLEAFVSADIVKEYAIKKGMTHYEYKSGHSHHHLVCTNCNRIEDFTICAAQDISKKVLNQSKCFTSITSHNFELFGLCKICSK